MTRTGTPEVTGPRSHLCTLVPDVCANRMRNADATAGCNHVVILHGEMTTAWLAAGFGYPRSSWAGIVRDHFRREHDVLRRLLPTLRIEILRERWRASRLPSQGSALRGLDPHHALPESWHLSERRRNLPTTTLAGILISFALRMTARRAWYRLLI
jgi:hypothetical protein